MKTFALDIYRKIFARKRFIPLHRAMFMLSLKGQGFLNSDSPQFSGESAFLRRLLNAAPCESLIVLDVGANEGTYASAVKTLAPAATVYAFEPHPETFKRLKQAATRYGYQAFNVGCGATAGPHTLYDYDTPEGGSTHASLYQEVIVLNHHKEATACEVQIITLDAFIHEHSLTSVHLLKIDTEGHELNVMQGCQQSLHQRIIDVIQFEFSPMNVVSKVFFKDFYDMLPDYHFYRMLPDELAPIDVYDPLFCELFVYHNLVAIRKGCQWAEMALKT